MTAERATFTMRSELLSRTRFGYSDRSLTGVAVDDSERTTAFGGWPRKARLAVDVTDLTQVVAPGPIEATGVTGSDCHAVRAPLSPQLWNSTIEGCSFVRGSRSSK
mmetsp:Transcript_6665/g.17014  ORF Transcript_6665/g.17014 Transcript_6665/m.17014 type:complete len:106 (+) Transcript_6665:2342-2659(+)